MYGAVIGDLAGSIYEYDQLKKIKPIKMDKVIPDMLFIVMILFLRLLLVMLF